MDWVTGTVTNDVPNFDVPNFDGPNFDGHILEMKSQMRVNVISRNMSVTPAFSAYSRDYVAFACVGPCIGKGSCDS